MPYHHNHVTPPRGTRDDSRSYGRDRDRHRDHEPYQHSDRPYRHESRPHEHDYGYEHSRVSDSQQSRSRSPGYSRDAPRGPRSSGRASNYHDRDAPRSRSRSRSPAAERFVSRDVIIEGFGGDLQDDDVIHTELVDGLGLKGVEKVTLIRDRKTGASRGFAFVHFSTTKDSMAFVDRFGPSIRMREDRCRIAFSKERDESDRRGRRREDEGEEWRCRVCMLVNYPRRQECFRCSTPRSEVTLTGTLTHPTPTHFTNDGERDMAISPPSQFILFRNLEAGINEEIFAKGVLKLTTATAPDGAAEESLRRVLLVRDRRSDESWRFGFAEFSTAIEAQKAFKVYERARFTISSKPVAASYIHAGVFVPVYNAPREAERFTFFPLSSSLGGGLKLAYWDEEGYVSELLLREPPLAGQALDAGAESKSSDQKKGKKRKAECPPSTSSAAEKLAAKKATLPAHLQFWQNRHSELHGLPKQQQQQESSNNPPSDLSQQSENGAAKSSNTPSAPESFADLNKLACLLCSRVFKTTEKLREHERVSSLHADNLKNPELVETARKKLAKSGSATAASTTPEYRDRAKERRQAFGPSTAPASGKRKDKQQEAEEKRAEAPPPGKGAVLLGKMGWTQGQGLGATGEGRTEHVVADVYTAGVGLGMKGGKVGDVEEAARSNSGGYREFVNKTKERAKERYQGME